MLMPTALANAHARDLAEQCSDRLAENEAVCSGPRSLYSFPYVECGVCSLASMSTIII